MVRGSAFRIQSMAARMSWSEILVQWQTIMVVDLGLCGSEGWRVSVLSVPDAGKPPVRVRV